MKATKIININIGNKGILKTVDVVQYDTGVQLLFNAKDFTIPSNTTATAFFQKPSGKFVYQNQNIKVSANQIIVDVENQALVENGKVGCQVKLTNGSDTITTFTIILKVWKSLSDASAVESKTVIPAFDAAVAEGVAKIKSAAADIETIKNEVTEYMQRAENAAIAAEANKQIIDTQIIEFSTHITEKTSEVKEEIISACQTAVEAVAAQQNKSIQAVKDQTAEYITEKETVALQAIENKSNEYATNVNKDIQAVNNAGAVQITAVESAGTMQVEAINNAGTTQVKNVQQAISDATAATGNANAVAQQLIQDRDAGLFKGDKGDKGDKGESGVTAPTNGFFTLSVDDDGDLWAHYADNPPPVELDEDGNLYYVVPD